MDFSTIRRLSLLLVVGLSPAPWIFTCESLAAEIRFRETASVVGPVVQLSDVADVLSTDPAVVAQLSSIDLFATPPAGQRRFARIREVQDLLLLRGHILAEHRFSGAGVVEVSMAAPVVAPEPAPTRGINSNEIRRAEKITTDAVLAFLKQQQPNESEWTIRLSLTEAEAMAVLAESSAPQIQGGQSPWTGSQQFAVLLSDGELKEMQINADITLPPRVVVAVRSIAKGALLMPADVEARSVSNVNEIESCFGDASALVGKQVTRALTVGQPIRRDSVSAPLLVTRGEAVTVYARAAGLQVKTLARAREDGSANTVILVESLQNRATFLARVTGPQQVEVVAQSMDVHSTLQ